MAKVRNIESVRQKILEPEFLTSREIQTMLMERGKLAALSFGMELLEEEVGILCGRPFERKEGGLYYRGGSEKTRLVIDGVKYPIRRPRVHGEDGECELETLNRLHDKDLFDDRIADRMMNGVTTRNYDGVISAYANKLGVKKSSVSRAFKRASQEQLDEINHSKLEAHTFVAIVIDGIEFAGRTIVGALGVTATMQKIPLGIREGSTENSEVVKDLLSSIVERGFKLHCAKLLAILDGSKALRKGLNDIFGDRLTTQRCWIHKLRNLLSYAPKGHHKQIQWRMKKLMSIVNYAEALKELDSITTWLSTISVEAKKSMQEVGEELLTVHKLGITGTLRKSLTTTNMIESMFSVVRRKTNRVTNWDRDRTQILRWVAASICSHKSKMRRVMGFRDGVKLVVALGGELDLQVKTA
jgi:transposase-like protein